METTLTLAELQRRQVAVAPHEAVAVAQQLMHDSVGSPAARPPFGPPSLDTVAISATGTVHCTHSDATPSVPEVAIVLQRMLAQSASRVPGGLRYAIGRALHEVEAPPFDSLAEFSQALERFERRDRQSTIAALYARAVSTAPELLVQSGDEVDGERRRRTPTATEIRRQLRDADLRLYQIQQLAQGAFDNAAAHRQHSFRGPVVACMLTGVALVVATEVTRVAPAWSGAQTAAAAAATSVPSTPLRATALNVSGVPLPTDVAPAAILVSTAPTAVRSNRDSGPSPTVKKARVARTGAPALHASAARQPRTTPAVHAKREQRDDERGLLRIRFVWNNPFK
jgi:hypothetical protein